MSKCCWKNGAHRLAGHRVATSLQWKCRFWLSWSGWGLRLCISNEPPGWCRPPLHGKILNPLLRAYARASISCLFIYLCVYLFILGLYVQHMEVPRPGVKLELQLPAYTTAPATQDLSHNCDLCRILWQHRIFNPPREASDTVLVLNPLSHSRNSLALFTSYLWGSFYLSYLPPSSLPSTELDLIWSTVMFLESEQPLKYFAA